MYLLSLTSQAKNVFYAFWNNSKLRKFVIYTIVFLIASVYIASTLNSLVRRDRIELPPAIEQVLSSIYAAENLEYKKRMEERNRLRAKLQKIGQQTTHKGGFKTIFTPAGAAVILVEVIAISAICCFIIYLLYRRFTVDTIAPLPILSTRGQIDEKD